MSPSPTPNWIATPAWRSLKILLAEDGRAHRQLARTLLKKWGHTVVCGEDGQETVDAFQREAFDLVLMDIQMPLVDGFEATRQIRRLEATTGNRTPIIAMTAGSAPNDRQRCLKAGMDEYLTKPISRREFEAVLARLAPNYQQLLGEQPPTDQDQPLIDWNVALVSVDGDAELLAEVIAASLEELPKLLRELQDALQREDGSAASRLAHTTKATGRTFGISKLLNLATRIEQLASLGNLAEATQLTSQLECLSQTIAAELRDHASGDS